HAQPRRDADGHEAAERVLGPQRDADAEEPERDEQADDEGGAEQTELLGDDREDEVGVRVGQEPEFGARRAEADAEQPAGRAAHLRLDVLVAGVQRIVPRVEDGEHAGAPVALPHRRHRRPAGAEHAPPDERRQRGSGDEQQGEGDGREHDRRAEVRLQHDERGEPRERDEHGPQGDAGVADPRVAARQQVGGEEQQRQLGELRRLDAERADTDPARRTVHVLADPRQQDDHEQRRGDGDERQRETAQAVVVETQRDQEQHAATDQPHHLPLEVVVRRALVLQRGHRRSREHHDEADHVEHDDDGEQQHVTRRLRRSWRTSRPCRLWTRPRRGRPVSSRRHGAAPIAPRTRAAKSSPRSPYDLYQSKEAQAGDSRTTSPFRANPRASSTASAIDDATTTGRTPSKARSTSAALSPMATTARMRAASPASTPRSRPLFCPPATSTTESKERNAASAALGVVAFESSYHWTPSSSATSSMRWRSPRKATSASWHPSTVAPPARAVAAAASALATSCGKARQSSVVRHTTAPSSATSASLSTW